MVNLVQHKKEESRHMKIFSELLAVKEDLKVLKPLVSDTNARFKAAKELKME